MAEQETIFTIPLRKEILKVPKYQRTKKAIRSVRSILVRRFKSNDIIIGQDLNMHIHEGGHTNPPTRIKVKVYKYKEKLVADMIDAPILEEEQEKKKGIVEKIKDTVTGKKKAPEEVKEEKLQEEKKEVLKHPPARKEEKSAPRDAMPRDKKAGERELKKEIFSKTQKPKHEKKK